MGDRDRSRRGVPCRRPATPTATSMLLPGWWGRQFCLPTETMKSRRRAPSLECLESRQLLTTIAEYPLSSPSSGPVAITSGQAGALWFLEQGANQIGSVDKGKYADVIAVDADPVADITQLKHVSFVMKAGKVIVK